MTDFKWSVLLLDDNPSDLIDFKRALEERGLTVCVLHDPSTIGSAEGVRALRRAHVALIDMKWQNFGSGEVDESNLPEALTWRDSASPETFTQAWIESLKYWSGPNATTPVGGRQEWPRAKIGETDLGLWIAALLSHLNQDCESILYSSAMIGNPGDQGSVHIGSASHLAALGRFRNARFAVVPKSNIGPGGLDQILPSLRRVQARFIESSTEFRNWAIGSVLVPTMLSQEPVDGQLWQSSDVGEPRRLDLKHRAVFPQLAVQEGTISELRDLVLARQSQLRPGPALEAILHDLDDGKLDGVKSGTLEKARRFARRYHAYCLDVGEAGAALARGVATACAAESVGALCEALREVWRDAFSRLYSAHWAIAELCRQHNGKFEGVGEWPKTKSEALEALKGACCVTGDMAALRAFVSALASNVTENGGRAGSLSARLTDGAVILTWTDDSRGFANVDSLGKAVVRSSQSKGVDRGLPRVFSAALELGATRVSVLMGRPAAKQWRDVLAAPELLVDDGSGAGFGVELTVPKGSRGVA